MVREKDLESRKGLKCRSERAEMIGCWWNVKPKKGTSTKGRERSTAEAEGECDVKRVRVSERRSKYDGCRMHGSYICRF